MNMFRSAVLSGIALFAVTAVVLSGSLLSSAGASAAPELVIPAPLADPTVCGYFRLKEGFDRLAASPATATGDLFATAFRIAGSVREQVRERAGGRANAGEKADPDGMLRRLREFATTQRFVPEDLFIYARGPGEYAVLVTGPVTPEAWEPLFPAGARMKREEGFTVNPVGAEAAADRPILHVGRGFLLLCPAGLEGNILDALRSGAELDAETWKAFHRMAGLRPVAALEADIGRLLDLSRPAGQGPGLLPFPWDRVRTLRCLIDARVIKAQLYAPDENARAVIRQAATGLAGTLKTVAAGTLFAAFAGSVTGTVQNTSVFIEGRGLEENAPAAGITTIGILSRLLCRAIQ
ncbi:MAG TPA: hypothetical protein VIV61_14650 [Candidatus Ozemobacteraceae bacterium]